VGRGFALGFGVGGGCWFVFEDVAVSDKGQRLGVGADELGPRCVDSLHVGLGLLELV